MSFVPLHVHSTYSLLDGLSKPHQIAQRCVALGHKACAITDHGGVAAVVSFMKECNTVCVCGHQKGLHPHKKCNVTGCTCINYTKYNLKPILGTELYICATDSHIKDKSNKELTHLVVLAKNLQGWKDLIKITSLANSPDNFYIKPRLNLARLAEIAHKGNLIAFSGHPGSDLANIIFSNKKAAYNASSIDEVKNYIAAGWHHKVIAKLGEFQEAFGKENFSIEIQNIDKENLPAVEIISQGLRYIGKKTSVVCTATPDAHYPAPEDAADQRVLLATKLECSLKEVERKLDNDEEFGLSGFFKSNKYYIPSSEEMAQLHTEAELAATQDIADRCEIYDILNKPVLPKFDCPAGCTPAEYMKQLCEAGWQKKVANKGLDEKVYRDRLNRELNVINEANLSGYFFIVKDYCDYAKNNKWLMSPSRGSCGGSLTSHLLDITSLDPIAEDLLFERFYNAGRNTPGHISLPDIDCDFPVAKRDKVKDYVKNKYGQDKVSDMITFSRMQGRSALRDVLRAHEACSYEEMNKITKLIPDEHEIADQLQLMREATGEASIIQWALENSDKELREWCYLNDDGSIEGQYKVFFEQAIRIEGSKRSQGKHPSGVIISTIPLDEVCPMLYDKSNECRIAGMEMGDLEALGCVKFDILGVAALDKLMRIIELVGR